jgi:hypothetical protein
VDTEQNSREVFFLMQVGCDVNMLFL